jgi:hypothetical protein
LQKVEVLFLVVGGIWSIFAKEIKERPLPNPLQGEGVLFHSTINNLLLTIKH